MDHVRGPFRRGAAAIVVGCLICLAGCVGSPDGEEQPTEASNGQQPSLSVNGYGASISPGERTVQLRLEVLNASPTHAVTIGPIELRGPLSGISGEVGFVRSSTDDEFVPVGPDGPDGLAKEVDVAPIETVMLIVTADVDCSVDSGAAVSFAAGDDDARGQVAITEFAAIDDDWLEDIITNACDEAPSG